MGQNITDFFASLLQGPGILIIVMIGFMVFMMISQRKKDKKVKDMLNSIKAGDRIRTIGGIYGTVVSIADDIATVQVGPDKVRLVFHRRAIATIEDSAVENTMEQNIDTK